MQQNTDIATHSFIKERKKTMTIIAKDGTTISRFGHTIHCSNGETYTLMGTHLTGPHGFLSNNVRSIEEAVGIVIGLHGGRRF